MKSIYKLTTEEYEIFLAGGELWQNILHNLGDSRKSEQQSLKLHYESHWKLQEAYEELASEFKELRIKYIGLLEEHIKCQDHLET